MTRCRYQIVINAARPAPARHHSQRPRPCRASRSTRQGLHSVTETGRAPRPRQRTARQREHALLHGIAYCLVEKRQHLRAKKRRSQDLMFVANHDLVVSESNGYVRTDHVPSHGGSVPLSCCPRERLPRVRGCRARSSAMSANEPALNQSHLRHGTWTCGPARILCVLRARRGVLLRLIADPNSCGAQLGVTPDRVLLGWAGAGRFLRSGAWSG
jgi:hypothetical protein